LEDAARRLEQAKRVLLTCHVSPDGDATGSMCALAAMLRERGREVTLYNPDQIPRALKWLAHADTLVHKLPANAPPFDLTVVVDCGDRKLLGERFPGPEVTGPIVALDHHASSRPFGELFYSDPSAASVGVLVARIAKTLGWTISPGAGAAIYVSIVADTGSFRYANTNGEAFEIAAGLVGAGAVDPWAVAERLGEQVPLSRYRLLSAALATITLEHAGKVAVMTITEEMIRAAGASWVETEGIVNYARAIEGVQCGVLLTPAKEKGVRVSLRARGGVDAGAICLPFGGGGHPGAAGCRLQGTIAEARVEILAAIGKALPSS
jgi:phosphoesterase RecJ-like protein